MQNVILDINPKLTMEKAIDISLSIYKYSTVFEMDPRLIAAVIAVESNFNAKAVGASHGEIGLMQLRPEFHMLYVKGLDKRRKQLFDVDTNIATGVKYIAGLKEVFGTKSTGIRFIEHYNIGPNKKAKTFKYTAKVTRYYRMFGGIYGRLASSY